MSNTDDRTCVAASPLELHQDALDLDDAGSLLPQTLFDDLRRDNRVLRAAVAHLSDAMGRVTLDMPGIEVDQCPPVDVALMVGRVWRVRVNR